MDTITKPSITRLARRAGVKSLSEQCYGSVEELARDTLSRVLFNALVVNSAHKTKTLMVTDIYDALRLSGYNVAQSNKLSTDTCAK